MIIDNTIDEMTAQYFCVVNKQLIDKAIKESQKKTKDQNEEKTGLNIALTVGPNPKKRFDQITKNTNESIVSEDILDILKTIFSSKPTWIKESLLLNYNKKYKTETIISEGLPILLIRLLPLIKGAARIGFAFTKKMVKTTVKHPVATSAAGLTIANIDTKDISTDNIKSISKKLSNFSDTIDEICGKFKPLVDFLTTHRVPIFIVGTIVYCLFKTRNIWFPYIRRLGYAITSGATLAKVDFVANNSNYTFEYTLKKNKWVLLKSGKIANVQDTTSFIKTNFAKRFVAQCQKNFTALFNNKDVVIAQATFIGGNEFKNKIQNFIANKDLIENNLYSMKVIF